MDNNTILDMDGRKLAIGHIVAVRYVWNSYVGEITMRGLCATGAATYAFFSPHKLEHKNTYQILGHTNPSHVDYNKEVLEWYNTDGDTICPVKIRIYETHDWIDACKKAHDNIQAKIQKNKSKAI